MTSPSPTISPDDTLHGTARRPRKGRRETVRAACNFCCARKIKCNAGRPHCSACLSRGRVCVYDTINDLETRGEATKRKCEDLERQLEALSLLRCDACQRQAGLQASEWTEPAEGITTSTTTSVTSPEASSEAAVAPHAKEIISALLNSTDEDSTAILAALRIGLPWRGVGGLESFLSLLSEPHTSWMGMMPTASPTIVQSLSSIAHGKTMLGVGAQSTMTFDRRIWIQELVTYDMPPSENVEHIQVVTGLKTGSHEGSSSDRPTRTYSGSKSSARCTYQVPLCAVASMIDIGDVRCPFVQAYMELSSEIASGADIQTMFGSHAHLAALSNRDVYLKAPRLSQVIATMVGSMKLEGDEGDVPKIRCSLMWLHWLLWQWLLDTTAASFHALPAMLRPTPWQLTVPHPLVFDFVFIPGLRDHLCQYRILDSQWLTQACTSVSCDDLPDDFYTTNVGTGELDLSEAAKAHIALPDSWSFGPSVRPFFYNLDKYIRIRSPARTDGE